MSSFLQNIVQDDFVWKAISERLPAGQMARGFYNINCPMPSCGDRRKRCGLRHDPAIVISCYNCGFKTGWSIGDKFGSKFRAFMSAIGMTPSQIDELNYRAFQYREVIKKSPEAAQYVRDFATPKFETTSLPPGAKSFSDLQSAGCPDQDFVDAQSYVVGRGIDIAQNYEFYWSPDKAHQMNRRVIIPMLFEGRTVGFSARAIDAENKQRYHMISQTNFLFNAAALSNPNRDTVILAEGILDAIALDCVGLLGARLNAEQIAWIKSYNKKVIMLVDRDKRGQDLVDVALANDWHVSFCVGGINGWWDPSVKDAAQATSLYGRLWTLTGVIEEATNNKMEINYQRKKLTR